METASPFIAESTAKTNQAISLLLRKEIAWVAFRAFTSILMLEALLEALLEVILTEALKSAIDHQMLISTQRLISSRL